jgi:hypothetical protein
MSKIEKIVFLQYQEPGLKAGDYRVHAELSVQSLPASALAAGASDAAGPPYIAEKLLRVSGDRFVLTPGSVDSVYPPEGASGNFSRVVPHVVLNRSTLPWERTIFGSAAAHAPWMALLLVTEEELRAEGLALATPTQPGERSDHGDLIPCELLTLSGALWSKIAPKASELPLLAHVRRTLSARKMDNTREELEYSLVIGNRLPAPDQSCFAFLVSLEDMESKLHPAVVAEKITLPVLYRWRFFAIAESRSFGTTIAELDKAVGLSLPHGNAEVAKTPLAMGFTPLPHDLRVGGETFSWYRGPFTPYGTQRTIKRSEHAPVEWGDAVTFYDPELGMMDVSCSSAWTLGRLLALNDTSFAQTVYKWKRHTVRSTVERSRFLTLTGSRAGAGPLSLHRRESIEHSLAGGLSNSLVNMGGITPQAAALHAGAVPSAENKRPGPVLSASEQTRQLSRVLTEVTAITELHHLDQEVHLLRSSSALAAQPEPGPEALMATWLAELALLKSVPFHYLVPDERMLPPESVRFFQIDASWLQCLHDGALSIGRVTDADLSHERAFQPVFQANTERATAVARPQARRLLAQGNASPWVRPMSGFLLRSEAITQWPDMEVEAKAGKEAAVTLRQQRVGPVLLCLFDRVVDSVALHQPAEGVHFGFLAADAGAAKKHRAADGSVILDDDNPLPDIPFRDDDKVRRVLNIGGLASWVVRSSQPASCASHQFALGMVTGVDRVRFCISADAAAVSECNTHASPKYHQE